MILRDPQPSLERVKRYIRKIRSPFHSSDKAGTRAIEKTLQLYCRRETNHCSQKGPKLVAAYVERKAITKLLTAGKHLRIRERIQSLIICQNYTISLYFLLNDDNY